MILSYMKLNAELVENFGNLERICNQIYDAQHGITCYIEDMEYTYDGSLRVANWEHDLRQLKDIRHKRNKLSHGEVSFNSPWAEPDDIDFILEFYGRLLNGSDPLALYRKAIKLKTAQKSRTRQNPDQLPYTPFLSSNDSEPPKPSRSPIDKAVQVALFGIIAVICIAFIAIIYFISNT